MASADLIERFAAHLREIGSTDATIDCYTKNLARADRDLEHGIDLSHANELRAWLWADPDLQPASRRAYHSSLKSFHDWAEATGELDFNPMKYVPRPKVQQGLPRVAINEHVRWAVAEAPWPHRLWGTLAAYAGLRCIEVSRLRREDVSVSVTTVQRGKGNKPRLVPTHPLIWTAVRDLPEGPITNLTRQQISTRYLQLCLRLGMRNMSMHRLRGWFATYAYKVTKDAIAVQRLMGHESFDNTRRYLRIDDEQLEAIINGLPTFGGAGASPAAA